MTILAIKFVSSLSSIYEKLKLECQNKPRPKCTGEITTTNMFFPWVLLYPRTSNLPTNQPPTTYPPTHRLPTQRIAESVIIFERLDNRNIFILQNTKITEKTFNYTSVYYPKNILVSIKIHRGVNYIYFCSFKTLMHYSSPDIFISQHFFFSVHSVSIIYFHEVIDLTKQLFVVKAWTLSKYRSIIFES